MDPWQSLWLESDEDYNYTSRKDVFLLALKESMSTYKMPLHDLKQCFNILTTNGHHSLLEAKSSYHVGLTICMFYQQRIKLA